MNNQKIIIKNSVRSRSTLGIIGAVLGILMSVVYITNPTAGIFELLPDNLPIVGNIDEAAATYFLFMCLRYLGLDLIPFKKK